MYADSRGVGGIIGRRKQKMGALRYMGAVRVYICGGTWVDTRLHAARSSRFGAFWLLGITVIWFGFCLDVGYRSPTGSVTCGRCGRWGEVRVRL